MFYIIGFCSCAQPSYRVKYHSGIVVVFFSFVDLHRAYTSAGQSKQRAAHLLHFGKHPFKLSLRLTIFALLSSLNAQFADLCTIIHA